MGFACRCLKEHLMGPITDVATPEQMQRFKDGWCPMCIGLCNCKRCCSLKLPGHSLASHGPQQHAAFARHVLAWVAPEVRRLHEAKAAEVGASSRVCWLVQSHVDPSDTVAC